MAKIVPYAEQKGQEKVAPRIAPEEASRVGLSQDGQSVSRILSKSKGDVYRIQISPANKELLSSLKNPDRSISGYLEAGYVEVPIGHLRSLAADTPVVIGYSLEFTEAEIVELGL